MGLSEVSNILWKERQLLELLLFKLETEQLILSAGKTRFLADATREVEVVMGELKEIELFRSIAVQEVAVELGLPTDASLRELSEKAPTPWNQIFDDHRQAFLQETQEISMVSQLNRELLATGHKAAKDALEWIASGAVSFDSGVDTYSAGGKTKVPTASGAKLIDEAL